MGTFVAVVFLRKCYVVYAAPHTDFVFVAFLPQTDAGIVVRAVVLAGTKRQVTVVAGCHVMIVWLW